MEVRHNPGAGYDILGVTLAELHAVERSLARMNPRELSEYVSGDEKAGMEKFWVGLRRAMQSAGVLG